MKKELIVFSVLAVFILVLTGCTDKSVVTEDGIEINQAHIYLPAAGADGTSSSEVAAAYMVIENTSGQDDALIGASCDFATAELHTMAMDGDMMKMSAVESFPIPDQGGLLLESGGNHIMFIGLRDNIKVGEEKQVTLVFEKAGIIVVPMLVTAEK